MDETSVLNDEALLNRMSRNPDLLRNLLIQTDYDDLQRIEKHSDNTNIQNLLQDQTFWRAKLENDAPQAFEYLSRDGNFDWKSIYLTAIGQRGFNSFFGDISEDASPEDHELFNYYLSLMTPETMVEFFLTKVLVEPKYLEYPEELVKLIRQILESGITESETSSNFYKQSTIPLKMYEVALLIDDVDFVRELIDREVNPPYGGFIVGYAQSIEAIELLSVFGYPEEMLQAFIRVCTSPECLENMISKYNLRVESDILLKAAPQNADTTKYLIEIHHADPVSYDSEYDHPTQTAITEARYDTLVYLMSLKGNEVVLYYGEEASPYSLLREALSVGGIGTVQTSGEKLKLSIGDAADYIDEKARILEYLLGFEPVSNALSNVLSSKELVCLLRRMNQNGLGSYKKLHANILNYLSKLTHDLRFDYINDILKYTKINRNWIPIETQYGLMLDHRYDASNNEKVHKLKRNKLLSIRDIHPIKEISNQEKFQALLIFDELGQLEPVTSELIRNERFEKAYLASPDQLAQMLNDSKIPYFPHVNSAAAAALYANEIDTFYSLVPYFIREDHKKWLLTL